jgi:glycosyltransferase involved in cell wall biosynthesis
MAGALLKIPQALRVLWRATGKAEIVHSGIVGWPFPPGWLANPMALLRGRKLVLVVESATWRLTGSRDDDWKRRVRSVVFERAGRWCVEHADLSFFTQPSYRSGLFVNGRGRAEITPATWINSEDIADPEAAREGFRAKLSRPRSRLLFAGRLTSDKGVDVLLDAIRRLDKMEVAVDVHIIGEGTLRGAATQLAAGLQHTRISMLDPVPYGRPFFELLRDYEAVLVPSLSDEQPRIVFDAYSQGIPVIASDTPGLVAHVVTGKTGYVVPRGDARALADAIELQTQNREQLMAMGLTALAEASQHTHRAMHLQRWRAMLECFGS